MALDHEELKRRRQERQRQREAKRKRNRGMLIRLCIAIAVFGAVILGIFLLSSNRRNDTPPPSGDIETTGPADTVIHLAAAGDLNVTDRVVASGTEEYDYTQTFLDVGYLLGAADISVVNFEGNLAGTPYGSSYVSAPKTMMEALDAAGVDLVQLANSYSIKNGMSGLSSTIDAVRSSGMEPLGVYANQEEFQRAGGYTVCNVKGIRIAFTAFTKGMDGMTLPAGNENCVNLLYSDYDSAYQQVDVDKINAVMDAIEKEKPDLVVALVHWGSEFNDTISTSQEKICQLLRERGVNAIIGTHPHYVQQMVFDPENGCFVAYSLGDFFGDAPRAGSEYSLVLDLEITKSAVTGETKITGYSYTPIFTATDGEKLQLLRIHEAMAAYENGYMGKVSQATYEAMGYALERIEKRVTGQ